MSSTPPSAFPVIRLFDPADGLLATEAGSPSTSAWPQTRECLRYPQKNLAGPQRELESLQIWHPVFPQGRVTIVLLLSPPLRCLDRTTGYCIQPALHLGTCKGRYSRG